MVQAPLLEDHLPKDQHLRNKHVFTNFKIFKSIHDTANPITEYYVRIESNF